MAERLELHIFITHDGDIWINRDDLVDWLEHARDLAPSTQVVLDELKKKLQKISATRTEV